ncbi:MAG: glycosyltransferase family 1 protein [bacterium]
MSGAPPRAIGIDARKIHDAGIGRHVEGLLGALAALDGPERFVLFLRDPDRAGLPGDLPQRLDPDRFRLARCAAPLYSVRELLAFRGVARAHRLGLLHIPHYVRPFVPGSPVTVTIHDAIHLEEPPSWAAWTYARAMMAWAVRSSAALLTVSEASRADLERVLPESRGKWHVAPNGVDLVRFARPSEDALAAFRRARGLDSDFVLVVASHRPHKNLAAAVRAFSAAAPSDLHLVLPARDDEAARRLAPFVRGVPRARLLAPVPDAHLPGLYAAARVVLVPSRREGFGLPGLEAAACGAAVLASPIAAHREVLGDAAAYAATPSVDDLAEALRALASDAARRAALARAGPARAALFPWRELAARTLAVWRSVLDPRAPGSRPAAPSANL